MFWGLTDSPYAWGEFKWPLLIGLLATWIWIVASTWKGTKTVSKVVWFTVLVPWALLIVFVIRSLTLPGAIDGLNLYLTPDFAKLTDLSVWLAAYTQVFYSLSVGSGIMIAYGSFLPRKAELGEQRLYHRARRWAHRFYRWLGGLRRARFPRAQPGETNSRSDRRRAVLDWSSRLTRRSYRASPMAHRSSASCSS